MYEAEELLIVRKTEWTISLFQGPLVNVLFIPLFVVQTFDLLKLYFICHSTNANYSYQRLVYYHTANLKKKHKIWKENGFLTSQSRHFTSTSKQRL